MVDVYVASGTGTGPTAMAAYDAALAAANLHNYNLVSVSSIVPADASIERVDRVPDRGRAGNRLTVVQARATTDGPGRVCAGLGWATGPGPGLFYEATGTDPAAVADCVRRGIEAGRDLREWTLDDPTVEVESAAPDGDEFATAVVVATLGESEPLP